MELAPPADLAPLRPAPVGAGHGEGEGHYDQPVLPDGCIDLIASERGPAGAGPSTEAFTVRLAPGAWSVGAQFHLRGRRRPCSARGRRLATARGWPPTVGPGGRALGERLWRPAGAPTAWRCWSRRCGAGRPGRRRSTRPSPAACASCGTGRHADPGARRRGGAERTPAAAAGRGRRRVPTADPARVLRFQRFLDTARRRPGGHDLAGLAATLPATPTRPTSPASERSGWPACPRRPCWRGRPSGSPPTSRRPVVLRAAPDRRSRGPAP